MDTTCTMATTKVQNPEPGAPLTACMACVWNTIRKAEAHSFPSSLQAARVRGRTLHAAVWPTTRPAPTSRSVRRPLSTRPCTQISTAASSKLVSAHHRSLSLSLFRPQAYVCPRTQQPKDYRGYDWFANGTADISANGTKSVDLIRDRAISFLDDRAKSPEEVRRVGGGGAWEATARVASGCLAWLDTNWACLRAAPTPSLSSRQPFFLYLPFQNIHLPYIAEDVFYNMVRATFVCWGTAVLSCPGSSGSLPSLMMASRVSRPLL